jgi:hypothetical protein
MLGRQIVPDELGKVIGARVLPAEGGGPRLELTFQTSLTVLGVRAHNTGTVTSTALPTGVMHADGQGIAMGEGGEMVAWTFNGVGHPTGPGMAATFSGIVRFTTAAPNLAELNGICAVVSAATDAEQTMRAELWEWT